MDSNVVSVQPTINVVEVTQNGIQVEIQVSTPTVIVSAGYIGLPFSDAANVGAGAEVYKGLNGATLEFRTLVEGDNITITEGTNDITITATPQPITRLEKTSNHVLVLTDAYKLIDMNLAGDNTLTVPPNASVAFDIGTTILVSQYGAGVTEILAGSGVTIRSEAGYLKLYARYCGAVLIKIGTNEWYLQGALKA